MYIPEPTHVYYNVEFNYIWIGLAKSDHGPDIIYLGEL